MASYYEIICNVGVIGVCSVQSKSDDMLLHAAREDNVQAFGKITKAEFDSFGDKPWEKPISKKRWKPTVKLVLELEPIPVK